MKKEKLFDLYVLRRDGTHTKLTGYPMKHKECCVMKSKFTEEVQAKILFVLTPRKIKWRYLKPGDTIPMNAQVAIDRKGPWLPTLIPGGIVGLAHYRVPV